MNTQVHTQSRTDGAIIDSPAAAPVEDDRPQGLHIDLAGVSRHVATRRPRARVAVLDDVSLTIEGGELLAIVGPSGAGKTMALEAMAGVALTSTGSVRFDGVDLHENMSRFRGVIGYVPQDDIIHTDLPLRRTLRYAARLRLPSSTTAGEIDRAVRHAIDAVGLAEQADVRVGSLSGGQRKRASIAVELLTGPRAFFLDEPTSSLDPVTSADLMAHLRLLADGSTTVMFTTHSADDLEHCDRIVFMAAGGRIGYVGTVDDALEEFGVSSLPDLYRHLATGRSASHAVARTAAIPALETSRGKVPTRRVANALTQWTVLSSRTLETLVRNPLTLAILVGSPALIVGMFAVLFRPGAFDIQHPNPSSMVMIGYWVVFAAFFFGITYGLLQISTERTILRRERLVGLHLASYVASKVTVLLPFLLVVNLGMLATLRQLNRLPERPLSTYVSMALTLLLCSVAALALGLLASASVHTVAQATLALPMLCFPAVLFAGAILPVHLMATAGAALSTTMPTRWAFEAIGHDLGAREILAHGGSPLGPPLLASFGDAGTAATATYWAILAAFASTFLAATWTVLVRATRKPAR